jgi:hypothetical protein
MTGAMLAGSGQNLQTAISGEDVIRINAKK